MSLNSLIAYAILVLSLGVSTSFGQCPPLSEGKLPGSGMITHIITPVQQIVIARPQVPASFLVPVDLTRRPSIVANTGVLSSVMTSAITRRPNFATGSNVGFQGPVSIQVPGAGIATKIVEQDGRFIIVGASDTLFGLNNEQGLFLARFNADGTPDQTFGQGGSTRIILFAQNNMANNESPSVTLSPEGKIIVARTIIDMFPGNQPGSCVAVVRFDHDGSLDPNFGTGGFVYTTIKDQFKAFAVAVQPDDKVLVAGSSGHIGECLKEPCTMLATLVRYESNGQLDPGFGGTGVVRTTWFVGSPVILSTISSFSTLFVQENGLIAAAGTIQTGIFQASTGELIAPTQMLIAEYLPTGELNPVFGSSGATTLSFGGPFQTFNATSLTVRENGNILAGGSANLYAGNPYQATLVDQAFIFAELTPDGAPDGSFGNAGKVLVNINPLGGPGPSRPLDQLYKIMLDSAGDIYAAGTASGPVGISDYAIDFLALNRDGSLKQNFGTAGAFSYGVYSPGHLWLAQDALLTSGGRLVIAGTHWPNDNSPDSFVLWAYSIEPGKTGCSVPNRQLHN